LRSFALLDRETIADERDPEIKTDCIRLHRLVREVARRESERAVASLGERFDRLSSREREIMFQVMAGRRNKQIAHDIGIAESTVKVHRTNLMRKMKCRSFNST
jgi:FixJ family two-component response regulator